MMWLLRMWGVWRSVVFVRRGLWLFIMSGWIGIGVCVSLLVDVIMSG